MDKITISPPYGAMPYPSVTLRSEFRASLEVKWKNAIILKVLGRTVTYNFLHNRLLQLWQPKGKYSLLELGNDFFIFRSDEP